MPGLRPLAKLIGVVPTQLTLVNLNGSAIEIATNRTLTGDANANTLTAGWGNDTLSGANGNDVLHGGPGNHSMVGGNSGSTSTGPTPVFISAR